MPIVTADIKYYLSGGSANADPNLSLGGVRSATLKVAATLENLFANVTGDEAAAGSVKYRCMYVRQEHATLTWETVKAWIDAQTPSSDTVAAIGLDPIGVNGTATTIANEDTAPAGVTFSAPATKGAGLDLGNIAPDQHYAIWVRRTVTAGASAFNTDKVEVRVEGDTAA